MPLRASPVKVKAAAFLPPMRKTLVAPGFFEPVVLGEGSSMSLQTITAELTEPNK